MKFLFLSLWILLGAVPVLADPGGVPNGGVGQGNGNGNITHEGAPAPLLGFGFPSALAIGGVLLGAKFLRRKPPPQANNGQTAPRAFQQRQQHQESQETDG
jgi:hypothetical protein